MPNPTSKLNLVINGTTTQLDIHDANAVDLTSNQTVGGDKEFTGTTTAHDVIPSATDTYNFGSSTAQWKSVYAQTYYYNGTAWGLDKANTWTDTNTFSKTNSDTIQLKNNRVAIGETLSSDVYTQLVFKDKNTDSLAYIRDNYMANGTNNLYFYVRNKFSDGSPSTTGSLVYTFFGLSLDNTGKSYARLKGDFYPYTDNLYSLGTSTNQWNNAYIKSLTINGVACGDILTHNASEFVDVSSNQTVGGNKEFTDLQTIGYGTRYKGNRNAYILPEFTAGYSGLSIATLGFAQTLKIGNFVLDANNKPSLDTSKAYIQVATGEQNNANTCLMEPRNSTSSSLGTSANKWKSFNGINPGALSLPSISASGTNAWIALDTTDWVASLATSTAQKYMPPSDGWLNVRVDNAVALGLALTDGGNYMHQMVRSETPAGLALLLPVFKGKEVAILVGGNENFAYTRVTFYPCQGNV